MQPIRLPRRARCCVGPRGSGLRAGNGYRARVVAADRDLAVAGRPGDERRWWQSPPSGPCRVASDRSILPRHTRCGLAPETTMEGPR